MAPRDTWANQFIEWVLAPHNLDEDEMSGAWAVRRYRVMVAVSFDLSFSLK
jgi:hypothetical protein